MVPSTEVPEFPYVVATIGLLMAGWIMSDAPTATPRKMKTPPNHLGDDEHPISNMPPQVQTPKLYLLLSPSRRSLSGLILTRLGRSSPT